MTGTIEVYSSTDPSTTKVTLTNLNCTVQYASVNPLVVIPVGGGNQITFNLTLNSVRFTLTFDLTDGIGSGSNFKKLLALANMGTTQPSYFVWGADTYGVDIESFVASTQPGKKDYMPGCTLVLVPHLV